MLILFIFSLFATEPATPESQQLHQIFEEYWEYSLESNPLFATSRGDMRFNHLLPDSSPDEAERSYRIYGLFLERTASINREALPQEDRVHFDIFNLQLQNARRAYETGHHLVPLNGWWDFHATFADLPNRVPLRTAIDYQNYLERLRAFPVYNQGYIDRMRLGMERGMVRPLVVFEDYLDSIESLITLPEQSRLFAPFQEFPASVTSEQQVILRQQAEEVITESVMLEYRRLLSFLRDEYLPAATETIGITQVPGGEEYYQYLIEYYTTLKITADEIHRIGLDEVTRIRAEMMEIVDEQGFGDDFDGFVEFLRTDPRFYAETAEELMRETAYVLKKMDGKLPLLFRTLPRLPYGIMEIPEHLAPRTTTAYYSRGAADGTRAGFYAVNTYNLPARPLFEVTALSLHEAVPGHHLQIALQQELENLPLFRTATGFTAYIEGWALYAERLGLEVGMYEDPFSNFGRLSYEMWRALRLVVDTGIHAKGWTREQAIGYMAENSALSLHNIRAEVNRYIFWPGQALAYKMGEIKIRELRNLAEEELRDSFDLRTFHDVILLSGSVPLSVLENNIREYIRNEKASRTD
ncbi:MAG: DUF885 domain-containing protein [Balneolaceae bacterium]|nr:MAG: DUF885 domain-containing protein [Balneolaceae bacterium]